ncbi:MAG TPA: DUF488 family protein [Nocardioidaceae bacterium]|nr:DUF488 family protein [Nocardioidaceae bacterium]
MAMIEVQRVREYVDGAAVPDGTSVFLVDRIWPRGIAKSELPVEWVKDVAPSTGLRQWFGHDRDKWAEFRRRYLAELKDNREAATPLLEAAAAGPVRLLFDAKDPEHNQAVVLAEWLRRVVS